METLFVLSTFLVILAISFAIPHYILKQQETSLFLEEFQSDILYLQEWNMYEDTTASLTIDPVKKVYTLRAGGTGKVIAQRKVPDHIAIDLRTLKQPIYYTANGTIKYPGTLLIHTETDDYKVIFPFGKGRSYIEKQ